jgi:ribosome-binding factor A
VKPEGAALSHKRVLRASEAIRRELSFILDRKLADPRIGMVTVTRVDLSEDLRYAKVFVSFLCDDEKRDESLRLLRKARRFVRGELAHALRFRVAPELTFLIDDSSKNYIRISSVLKDIEEEDSEGPSEQPDEDDGGGSQEDTGSA